MLNLKLAKGANLKILCLGSHCDDIEIGCGGTLLRLISEYGSNLEIFWVVFSSDEAREKEARESAGLFLQDAGYYEVSINRFRNSFFPYQGLEIKEYFEKIKHDFSPDLIFTHYRDDLHQDHRLISSLTLNTFRNHFILEYEIPKFDGDFGTPNFFVPLDDRIYKAKISNIMKCFGTQRDKHWFSEDLFLGVMRIRGMEANSSSNYAEAFYSRKIVF